MSVEVQGDRPDDVAIMKVKRKVFEAMLPCAKPKKLRGDMFDCKKEYLYIYIYIYIYIWLVTIDDQTYF